MSSLDEAMSKLSNLDGSEECVTGAAYDKFREATQELSVKIIDNLNLLKQEKNDFVRSAVANTVAQYGNVLDLKGMKPNQVTKSLGELGITAMYALQQCPVGIHIYIQQEGKGIAYKKIILEGSMDGVTGHAEVTGYDAAAIASNYVMAAGFFGVGTQVAAVAGVEAVKAGAGVAKVASDSTVQAANAVAKATEAGMSKKVAEKAGERVGAQVAKRVESSTAQQLMLHDAKAGVTVAKKVGTETAKKMTTQLGSTVAKGSTAAVTKGAQVATKMGAKGAEEAAKKIGETLAKESVQAGIGAGVIVVGALIGGIALYEACSDYTPNVYHYVEDNKNGGETGTEFVGFTMVKNNGEFMKLGVPKAAKSVVVTATDITSDTCSVIQAFPVVPNGKRKGLYGLYATTSTTWAVSDERKAKLRDKLNGIKENVMA